MNQSTKLIQKLNKEILSDKFCYRKIGSAITKWGAIEKIQYCYRNTGKIFIFKG